MQILLQGQHSKYVSEYKTIGEGDATIFGDGGTISIRKYVYKCANVSEGSVLMCNCVCSSCINVSGGAI